MIAIALPAGEKNVSASTTESQPAATIATTPVATMHARSLELALVVIEVLDGRARGLEIAADRDETVDFRTHAGAAEARPRIKIEREQVRGGLHIQVRGLRGE